MASYEETLRHVLLAGGNRSDRTGTGTISVFSPDPITYSLRNNAVPLITSKQVPWRMALREFMWMLSGSTNTLDLAVHSKAMAAIWDNWADADHNIGPTYGAQYRNAGGTESFGAGVDQIANVISLLADTPDTRRALISLWSVPELDIMALEPCMVLFQFSLRGTNLDQLELHVYQRSADMVLGVPFDLFQAGVLAHLIAREVSYTAGRYITATKLIWTAGDAHVYTNQLEAAKTILQQARDMPPMRAKIELPNSLELRLLNGSLTAGHIHVTDYVAAAPVSAPIAI